MSLIVSSNILNDDSKFTFHSVQLQIEIVSQQSDIKYIMENRICINNLCYIYLM